MKQENKVILELFLKLSYHVGSLTSSQFLFGFTSVIQPDVLTLACFAFGWKWLVWPGYFTLTDQ